MMPLLKNLTEYNKKYCYYALIITTQLLLVNFCLADSYDVLEGHEDEPAVKGSKFIPYGFYNENTEMIRYCPILVLHPRLTIL